MTEKLEAIEGGGTVEQFLFRLRRRLLKSFVQVLPSSYRRGSELWLIAKELQYGGYQSGVRVRTISDLEPAGGRNDLGHTGGDRMLDHGYAAHYSRSLLSFYSNFKPKVLVEVGILKGSGLAIWCDLFPSCRVIGLDIDLSYFLDNRANLESRGAFRRNEPEIYRFDQFVDNSDMIEKILNGDKIDIVIDDGHHSLESIESTMRSLARFLDDRFVYFVEDYEQSIADLPSLIGATTCTRHGELSILARGV